MHLSAVAIDLQESIRHGGENAAAPGGEIGANEVVVGWLGGGGRITPEEDSS